MSSYGVGAGSYGALSYGVGSYDCTEQALIINVLAQLVSLNPLNNFLMIINTNSIGPKGDIGEQGEQGPQGPVGPKGDIGEQGPPGDITLFNCIYDCVRCDMALNCECLC